MLRLTQLVGFGAGAAGVVPSPRDPYWNNVVLLLGFEGADGSTVVPDESPAARGNATVSGDAQIDTATAIRGASSGLFDGSGDAFSWPDHADFHFPGDFTAEFFCQLDADAGMIGVSQWNFGGDQRGWVLGYTPGQDAFFFQKTDDGISVDITVTGPALPVPAIDTTYHVALDRFGNDYHLYMDGIPGTKITDSTGIFNSTGSFTISGDDLDGTLAAAWDGHLDEVRITKGVARYAGTTFTPSPVAFPRQ